METAAGVAEQRRTQLLELLRAFGAAESDRGRQFARSQHLHPSDAVAVVEILRAETRQEVITPARLATRIGLSAGATSTLINRLEAAGHVIRSRDNPDRRIVELHSTPQVHRDAEMFFAPTAAALHHVLEKFSNEQLEAFSQLVAELNAAADVQPSE